MADDTTDAGNRRHPAPPGEPETTFHLPDPSAYLLCGTLTVAIFEDSFPEASRHVTVTL